MVAGSSPAGRTKYSYILSVNGLARWSPKPLVLVQVQEGMPNKLKYVWVTEWVYVSVLETGFCGFESHPAHQIYAELAHFG